MTESSAVLVSKMHSSKAVTSFFFYWPLSKCHWHFDGKTRHKNSQLIIFVTYRENKWNMKEELGIYSMKIMNFLWSPSEAKIEKKVHVIKYCFEIVEYDWVYDANDLM